MVALNTLKFILRIRNEVDKRMKYVVIFEKGENSYGASVPDLPDYKDGNPLTISTVFRLTVMTRAIRSTIYRG